MGGRVKQSNEQSRSNATRITPRRIMTRPQKFAKRCRISPTLVGFYGIRFKIPRRANPFLPAPPDGGRNSLPIAPDAPSSAL